ncbi:MAG: hypothetical protein L3J17_04865 [Candidatus Jettenia sp.]|nr:MAG: hypothetical protein L3J17_04865 [Candidatus Jettenia sp.]
MIYPPYLVPEIVSYTYLPVCWQPHPLLPNHRGHREYREKISFISMHFVAISYLKISLLHYRTIHNDISSQHSIIPGLTWNPLFFWIPVFMGMTFTSLINDAMYKTGYDVFCILLILSISSKKFQQKKPNKRGTFFPYHCPID